MAKILICDDELGVRESLKLILGDVYPLIVVENGDAVLETLKNSPEIKAVFLDIKMPKISGLDILAKIKERHPKVKVIIVSGYNSVETAQEASKLGADGYIVKPFESKDVLAAAGKYVK